jgi:hypothetical protein
VEFANAQQRIDVDARYRVGIGGRYLFYIDAALGAHHPQKLALGSIQQECAVVLGFDVARALHQDALDGVALDVHSEDRAGHLSGLVGRTSELYPASLAAAADLNLGLDDDLAPEAAGRSNDVLGRSGDAALGDRHVKAPQELLTLILK